nr:LysR family transcriptional regulator [uncultured Albidiferax sp.]
MDRISAMRVFGEVVATGSFTAAASALGMSRAMVTRHIAELEHWLGEPLLQRTTRRLSLTEAGEACMVRSHLLLELAHELEQVVGQRDTEPYGHIRIACCSAFGQSHLAAAMADYLARYPRVRVDLLLGDGLARLVEDRVDVAVRIADAPDANLQVRKLSVCRSVLCAAPAYLQRKGVPQVLEDLAQHNCLTASRLDTSQWTFHCNGVETSVQVGGNLSANDTTALVQAVRAGAGLSLQPTYVVAPLLQSGELEIVLPEWQPACLGIYAVYLPRRHQPASIRCLLDFLAERFGTEPAWEKLDAI